MQVLLEPDEAWSLMLVITSYIVDHSGISGEARARIRRWRNDRAVGTVEMDQLCLEMNRALGNYLDEKTTRQIRMRGRYITTRDLRLAARPASAGEVQA
ncbi:MAG TPA: hypothetical protein VNL95_10085 [Dehalococcoidia bacterium]|nr:hypothetical protein [Dehalococcoidia bacterium]